ncbi:MAG: hypothetical protein QOE72_2375 [Chloroflexota bacterium]|nr:hypothetical protein [Chloroflexota bacterium]
MSSTSTQITSDKRSPVLSMNSTRTLSRRDRAPATRRLSSSTVKVDGSTWASFGPSTSATRVSTGKSCRSQKPRNVLRTRWYW